MLHSRPTVPASQPAHRAVKMAVVCLASAGLFSGCAMWPKSLTLPFFGGAQDEAPAAVPAEAPPVEQQPAPAKPVVAVAPPAPVAVPAPVNDAPKMESTLIAGVPADTMSAATKASLGVPVPAAAASGPATAAKPGAAPVAGGELLPGFYLNVGLFAVPTNGVNAHKKLEAAGFPVFSDGIVNKKGALTRVRVGPFASKALAQAAAQKIHAMKLEAVVFQK